MLTNIQLLSALGALLLAQNVIAHGHITNWVIDGVSKNGFKPSGYTPGGTLEYGLTAERPTNNGDNGYADHTSAVVACGGLELRDDLEEWEITGGSKIVAQWDQWPESHKGPVIEYMASCGAASCSGIDAASLEWFKIAEANFDGTWPSMTITTGKNWEFTIPSGLAPGAYLVRHEIIAMHTKGSPQVYPVCFQALLSGSGSAVPPASELTTFPAAYKINPVFETWDLYNGGDQSLFTSPGPAVYGGGGGGGDAPVPAPAPSASASTSASASASVVVPPASSSVVPPASSVVVPPASSVVVPPASSVVVTPPFASDPVEGSLAESTASTASTPIESPPVSSAASSPTSAQTSTQPTVPTTPAPAPAPGGGGSMGVPAPAITENGTRFEVNGGSYHDRASAVQASCMFQMNECKKEANAMPNAQVGAGLTACDAQLTTCTSSASARKRDVVQRYSKRSMIVL